jgi:hypothetical protein
MAVANTLAYYVAATITAVKSFIVQAPVCEASKEKRSEHSSNGFDKL